MVWEPVSFNPVRGIDSGSYAAASLVYDGLVKYDRQMVLKPALAESFSISDDGLTYHFTLRPALHFSNGQAVTTGDVKASLLLGASELSPFKGDYSDIQTIEIKNERELSVKLSRRCQPLISRLAELRILPATLLDSPDHGNQVMSRHPVGTGPFRLVRWESGLELVFERNPYYWGAPAQSDRLIWRVVPDRNVLAVALARGEVDVAPVDGRIWKTFLANAKLPQSARNKAPLKVAVFNGNRTIYLGFNLEREPWRQLLIRQAFAAAIDRKTIADVFYGGYAVIPDSDFPVTNWAFSGDTKTVRFDPVSAMKLIDQAGYRRAGKLWVNRATHQPLALKIYTIKEQEEVAQAVADYLSTIGVVCEVETMEYSTVRRSYLQKGRFDAVLWSRSFGPDPECSIVWSSKGPLNFCRLRSKVVDDLIASARLAGSKAERREPYRQLQSYLSSQLPWVFLAQPKLLIAYKGDIENIDVKNVQQKVQQDAVLLQQKGQQYSVGLPWDNPVFNAAEWRR
ncbi:peptide-binding protein [soil metagenome]